MKAFTYPANSVDNGLRLDGVTEVAPQEAEIFIVKEPLRFFTARSAIDRLAYLQGNEERHVFFDIAEEYTAFNSRCLFFRCTLHQSMLSSDPNSIALPWPVEDFAKCVEAPRNGFLYDVSFHGWLCPTSVPRRESTESCLQSPLLRCDIARYTEFYGNIEHTEEGHRRKAEHWRSLHESRVALCPESIPGDFPYRFFEAMSAGRVPVLVGSGQVFPFADEIPYSEFTLHVNSGESSNVGRIVANFIKNTSDEELIRKGKQARLYWQKYLNRDDFPKMMTYAVKKKFQEFGYLAEAPILQ